MSLFGLGGVKLRDQNGAINEQLLLCLLWQTTHMLLISIFKFNIDSEHGERDTMVRVIRVIDR